MTNIETLVRDLKGASEYSKEYECEMVPLKDATTIASLAYKAGQTSVREKILDVKEALVRKARKVDYSDRTEYDEAAEMLDNVLSSLTLEDNHQ